MSKKFKIAHSLQDLQDQIILTLQDKPILNDGKLNLDEQDILQNDDIQQDLQSKHNVELKAKLKTIADASSSHLEAKNQGLSGMLPHYDDYSFKPNLLEVQEGSVIKQTKFKKSKALASDYHQNETSAIKLNAEYSSSKEDKKFKQKTNTKNLLNFLQDTAEDNVSIVKKQIDAEQIINGSIDVLRKKRILDNGIKSIVQNTNIDDEEESILLKSIERSRKKAQSVKKQQVFNILQAIKEEDQDQGTKNQKSVEIELNPIAYKSTDNIRQNKAIDLSQAVSGTSSAMFVHLPSERLAKKTFPKQEVPTDIKNLSKQQLDKMREQVQFLQDREVGIGLAGTLNYLRQNALLGKEEQAGRYNDKSFTYNDPNDKIKLQYRNASGKLMKPKEAYRYICAKFHGQGSGKNKIEIRKKRQLQQIRAKQQQNEGGNLLKLLEQHQAKTGEAHVVLNLGGKAANRPV